MVAARDGLRSAVRFTAAAAAAAAGLAAALAPAAVAHPASLLENTLAYPLGLTTAKSPAASPLPGHLLTTLGSGGHLAALVLLALSGLATLASLLIAPPATPAAAARRIAIGLTGLFLLSPATRFRYFIYPIALYWWAVLADREDKDWWNRPVADVRLPDVTEAAGAVGSAELALTTPGARLTWFRPVRRDDERRMPLAAGPAGRLPRHAPGVQRAEPSLACVVRASREDLTGTRADAQRFLSRAAGHDRRARPPGTATGDGGG